ncbi:universal stress family protein [Besnoitia besnoiti]|uniref:Universal stress family protein n=1 Tax=Besnoitia besnoiti TaxID=94643 RepID=A0A2A9LYY0_BESBE|nr:universal stress family protein [Besnoitia besnoiti]PFH31648.1 universal stress family protein [Besnoitia besnoiti]
MHAVGMTRATVASVDGLPNSVSAYGSNSSSPPCPLCASPLTSCSAKLAAPQRSPARGLLPPRIVPTDFLLLPPPARCGASAGLRTGSAYSFQDQLESFSQDGGRERHCTCAVAGVSPTHEALRARADAADGQGDSSHHCSLCGGVPIGMARRHSSFFQESVSCLSASSRSVELLIWGVRKLIERDFPCLYSRHNVDASRSAEEQRLDRSVADSEHCCAVSQGSPAPLEAGELPSTTHQTPMQAAQGFPTGASAAFASPSFSPFPPCSDVFPVACAPMMGGCCCRGSVNSGIACEARQIVAVSIEGNRQRDRKVLKWVRNNVLKSGDVVVLVTAWERAEDPKFLKVPGMILSNNTDASSYNVSMVGKLNARLKHVAASLLSDCRVYPLVVPLARVNKASVGDLLCQCAAELQADVLVVGSHGHTSLRQVLFGSVSRHVRSHATCKVVIPRI